jgi:HSP20 family protein
MPELVIWKRQKLSKMRKDMDRMLERILGEFSNASFQEIKIRRPHFELVETDTELVLRAEIPDMDPDDIEIDITDNVLTISGEIINNSVSKDGVHHSFGRRHSNFSKSILIPKRIVASRVKATYVQGLVKVIMPKYSGEEKRGVKVRLR